jgi:hypothetical protein
MVEEPRKALRRGVLKVLEGVGLPHGARRIALAAKEHTVRRLRARLPSGGCAQFSVLIIRP